jgi:predicted nicotinamide N-methyase|tara:strand:- start:23 stop:685 length:663 start_codon:yes stop_codon:yes gene_type:complete
MTDNPEALNNCIKNMLPDAYLSKQSLPQCTDIKLWLVDPTPMQRRFSQDEILAIQAYPAYWAFCWASGQVLARYILDNPELVRNKRVMDFGAGSGVVAIACAMAGAKQVIACDIDPDALLSCQENAALNNVDYELHGDLFEFDQELDLLIAADVLYDKANLPLLNIFLEKAPEVLVADSRVKNFDFPPYQAIGRIDSFTVPDLDELDEFRLVNLYSASRI